MYRTVPLTATAFVAATALMSSAALAQPAPGPAAASVPLALAIQAAQTAVDTCKANGYNVTATVMDSDLATRLVMRNDGAPDMTVQIGYRKAYTAIKTGMTSGEFGKTVPPPPAPAAAPGGPPARPQLPGPVNGDPNLITWGGGSPIKAGGKIVGALSVSGAPGGDKDEVCVTAGLAKIADRLK